MREGDNKAPILLVEGDSVDELRAVRAYQETQHTNRLLVARTTEHAMTLLKACANGLRFGLVLLDMHAPRFGAVDLLRRIRKDPHVGQVPVIVMAPPHEKDEIVTAISGQADAWVKKPDTQAEYCSLLERLLDTYLGLRSKGTCQERGR
jgi:CheY-like chemotaxis protein